MIAVNFALYVPPFGDYADARTLASLARDAEAAGWDGFFLWDHVAFDWITAPIVDPWIACTAIALATSRIRFGPMVTPLARRRPWKVARETVSLDHLSAGRLTLGVGLGGGAAEFDWLGEPNEMKALGERTDEALDVLNGLWRAEPFHDSGKHYQIKQAHLVPAPCQSPRIPIWVGGFWPNNPPFRRAARWDGVFPLARNQEQLCLSSDEVRAVVGYVRAHRADDTPFDVAHSGFTPGNDLAKGCDLVGTYAQAGVTWWMEN